MKMNELIEQIRIPSLDEQIVKALTPVKITSYALEKANYASRRLCELMEEDIELGFFLLGDNSSDRIIKDIYIAPDQILEKDKCRVRGKGVLNSVRMLRQTDMKILGWGHSHGYGDNFYSDIDDNTIFEFINDRGIKFQLGIDLDVTSKTSSIRLAQNGSGSYIEIVMEEGSSPLRVYGSCLDVLSGLIKDDYLSQMPFKLSKTTTISLKYFLGLTFNARNDTPYCAITYKYNGENKRIQDNIELLVIDEGNPPDTTSLDRQLYERVVYLQEKYNYHLTESKNNLERTQRYASNIDRMSYKALTALEQILITPETYLKSMQELNTAVSDMLSIPLSNPVISSLDFLSHQDYYGDIRKVQKNVMDSLAKSQSELENLYTQLRIKAGLLESRWRKNAFNPLVAEYARLISTIKDYQNRLVDV